LRPELAHSVRPEQRYVRGTDNAYDSNGAPNAVILVS